MKFNKISSLAIAGIISFWNINAQVNQDITVKIGGSYQKDTEYQKAIEKIKLDDAQLRVTYQFKYGVIKQKDISFITDTMLLITGDNYSIYFDPNDIKRRDAFSSYVRQNGPPQVFMSSSQSEFSELTINENNYFSPSESGETAQLYKDREKNFITVMDFDNSNFGASELYFYQEESIHIPWEIKEDTISVLGYLCTKANCDFGGRIYTAWFTQDIPINEGPYKFYGLPGMILKIEDSEKLFQFEAIGLEKLENAEIVIDENSRYLKCTKEEYSTIKKRMRENFTEFYREGMTLNYSYRKNGIEYIPIEKI
jgi:GLPGLI family protein